MSDLWIEAVRSLAPTLTALAALIGIWRARVAVDTNTAITQAAAKDTAVILGHVNSEKTADAKTIEFQAREIDMYRRLLAEKTTEAALQAQAAIVTRSQPAAIAADPGGRARRHDDTTPVVLAGVDADHPLPVRTVDPGES